MGPALGNVLCAVRFISHLGILKDFLLLLPYPPALLRFCLCLSHLRCARRLSDLKGSNIHAHALIRDMPLDPSAPTRYPLSASPPALTLTLTQTAHTSNTHPRAYNQTGGSISILYYLSLCAMSAIELAGFAEALSNVIISETGLHRHLCGSAYGDQVVFGTAMLVLVCTGLCFLYAVARLFGEVCWQRLRARTFVLLWVSQNCAFAFARVHAALARGARAISPLSHLTISSSLSPYPAGRCARAPQPSSVHAQARLAQVNRAMYARLSGTDRYQALKELAQQARGAIGTAVGGYKRFVRGLVKRAENPDNVHVVAVPLTPGMRV